MQADKLVMMANQIAKFFQTQPGTSQPQQVAGHINDFWDPRMRRILARHVEQGGAGLMPLVLQAMDHIRLPAD